MPRVADTLVDVRPRITLAALLALCALGAVAPSIAHAEEAQGEEAQGEETALPVAPALPALAPRIFLSTSEAAALARTPRLAPFGPSGVSRKPADAAA